MNEEQRILDRIAADAQAECDAIAARAQSEADAVVAEAQEKADRDMAARLKLAEAEAEKAAAKTISGAEMKAKKQLLAVKQEILDEVIRTAQKTLLGYGDAEMLSVLETMLGQADLTGGEVLLSARDKARFGETLRQKGYPVGEETRDIDGGFIVRCGDVEYNYSFASILTVEREEFETLAAGILFR